MPIITSLSTRKVDPSNVRLNPADNSAPIFYVQATEDSNYNPRRFSVFKKWYISILFTGLCMAVQINSSINGTVLEELADKYQSSMTQVSLGLTIFLVGSGISVIGCGPLTELHGRKNVVCYLTVISGVVTCAIKASQSLWVYILLRFLAGALGAPALLVGGSVLKDLFDDKTRGLALWAMSLCISAMPSVGGAVAKYLTSSGAISDVSNVNLIPGISIIVTGILCILLVPETYCPVINKRVGKKINRSDSTRADVIEHFELNDLGDKGKIVFTSELTARKESKGYWTLLLEMLKVPYKFFGDGIILIVACTGSFYSGSMYIYVANLPSIVSTIAKEKPITTVSPPLMSLMFTIGILTAGNVILLCCSLGFKRLYSQNGKMIPELRLIPAIIGAVMNTVSTFLIFAGGESFGNVSLVLSAEFLHGAGFFLTQQSMLLYVMEVYGANVASATSLFFMLRSILSGLFVYIGSEVILKLKNQAFLGLGIINACFLISLVALCIFGNKLRQLLPYCAIRTKYKSFDPNSAV